MPIVYRIDHDHRLVLVRGHGSLTDDAVFGYQRSVWSRQDVAGYSELVDVTEVTEIKLPSVQRLRDLASLAASMDDQSSSSRLGIVAPDDEAFGLGRMFQAYRGLEKGPTKEVGVFRTLAEAFAFLGITDPPPLPDVHEEITRISD
jgi:hypothetical protein